ncbi:MAG: CDP-alcohol phosphatidyltransferase family protein [Betaproteobacteria bacterium]
MSPSLASLLVVLALLFLSMAVYAARGRRPDADAQSKNAQFLGGLGNFVLHWFLWLVAPAATLSIRLGLGPDFYNFAGLAFGAVAGLALAAGALEAGGWALAVSGVCDIMDGRIARARGITSRYGAFIDSLLDRFIELFFFVGFAFFARQTPHGAVAGTLAVGASVLVSYARAMGESLGVECTGGLMQRGERLALLSLGCLVDRPLSAALAQPTGTTLLAIAYFIGVTSLLTAVHRTIWIARRLRAPQPPAH